MALTLSGTNGVVGAGFTVDASGVSVTAGVGTFSSIGAGTSIAAAGLTGALPTINGANITGISTSATSDYVKLQAATGTSAVADLTFDSLDVTTYRTFKFVFSGYPSTDDSDLYFRFRASGSDKTADAYNGTHIGVNGAGSMIDNAYEETYARISYTAGNNNYEGWRLELTVVPHVSGDPDYQNNFGHCFVNRYTDSNSHRGETYHFKYHQSDTTDGFKIYPASGNISAYSYTLYGLKR